MSDQTVNESEDFVLRLCRRSILTPWCYNNPRGKEAGKELCDILVVCEPHVIIVSVKDVLLKNTGQPEVDFQRWERRAIDDSIKQIYGAERWLASAPEVIRSDGTPGLKLPPLAERRVHRIAVAFGGKGEAPVSSGDSGKGFVHVMDEDGFNEVLHELDTITDLVNYLAATEACASNGCGVVINGSESNLLGWYLHHGRSLPTGQGLMIIGDGIWEEVKSKAEFKRRKEADRESYVWDRLIEGLAGPPAKVVHGPGPNLSDFEIALRVMAREDRFSRRHLGRAVREFFDGAKAGKLRSRILQGLTGTIYVLVYYGRGEDREHRLAELGGRCFIARHQIGNGESVLGIGINKHIEGVGTASDLLYLKFPHWSAKDDAHAEEMKADLGFFKNSIVRRSQEDEFPASGFLPDVPTS